MDPTQDFSLEFLQEMPMLSGDNVHSMRVTGRTMGGGISTRWFVADTGLLCFSTAVEQPSYGWERFNLKT